MAEKSVDVSHETILVSFEDTYEFRHETGDKNPHNYNLQERMKL